MRLPFITPTRDDRRTTTERLLAQEREDHHLTQATLATALRSGEHLHDALQEAFVRASGVRRAQLGALLALEVGPLAQLVTTWEGHDGAQRYQQLVGRPPQAFARPAQVAATLLTSRTHTAAVFLLRLAQAEPFTPQDVLAQGRRDQVMILEDHTPD